MPKKAPRNAFYFFMIDYKARCEKNGERFPNGLRDVQIEAGPEWDVLPPGERKKYEDMAKEEKARLRGDSSKKYTNQHNSFQKIDKQKLEEEDEKLKMNNYIEMKVRSLMSKKLLAEQKFYLIHVNYFCVTEGECYHPAELAITEFCLGSGVTNVYHTLVDPGPIPLGYRFDATQKSESTHKIPLDGEMGERDFYKIWTNIKRVLEPGRSSNNGDYPPMYTLPDNVNLNTSITCVKSVIKSLGEEYDNVENFPVYSLEKLFLELKNACGRIAHMNSGATSNDELENYEFLNIGLALMELEKDYFNYTAEISCEFHLRMDKVEFCSKSFVQRWVYLMCDHCCGDLDITLLPGRHVPENSDTKYRERQAEKEAEQRAAPPKPINWIDHSKRQATPSNWFPVQQPPLARPSATATLARPPVHQPIDTSEDSFPAIPVGGFGRGKYQQRGPNQDDKALSFASAMRKKK